MRFIRGIWVPILVTVLCLPAACSEQQGGQGDQSARPATPVPSDSGAQAPKESQAPAAPPADARSFLGVQTFTPGRAGSMRSYFLPSLQFSEMSDSNFSVGSGRQKFETINTVAGRLTFGKIGKHFQLAADYFGGGQIYNHRSDLNTSMHQFGISQSYQGRRWSFLLDDRLSYLPESSFGFGGFGFTGSLGPSLGGAFGSNVANLNPNFSPNGSLFTGRGSRTANTTAAQISYLVGPRSAITLSGSYGVLRFRQPGLTDSSNSFFLAGYSRTLTARDLVGFSYGFGQFKFQNSVPAFQNHLAQFSYGHRISGRMAMEFEGGAQLGVFRNPLAGSTSPLTWTARSTLNYQSRKGGLGLSYARYTTNGGGVLNGARTDNVIASWSTTISRHWSGNFGPGYSHNRSLPQTTSGQIQNTFDTAFFNVGLSRNLGRFMSMFLTYTYQTQRSDIFPCLAANCETKLLRHLIGFGFDWHPRQIVFD